MKHTVLFLCISSLLAFLSSGNMLGGYKKHENHANDGKVQEVAKFAVEKISDKEGQKLELVKILSVSTQVVAGRNYKLILDAATPEQKVQPYEATVYEPLGGKDLQLTEHKAVDKLNAEQASEQSSERSSGALLGGYKEVDADDSEVQEAADFATKKMSEQSNSLLPFELKKVLQAQQKVANGKVWDLKLELGQGKQPGKVYDVEVSRTLQNEFNLQKVTSA